MTQDNQTFTNLDFFEVKEGLKEYLKSQDQFKDYDFSGSNMNVLLDVLAYNTYQNNFYTNMAISEMFLDSARLKSSVVSHAKELNYMPRSKRSAYATISVEVFPDDSPATVLIPARSKFFASGGNESYTFYNEESRVIIPTDGRYILEDLVVYEGNYVEEFYRVENDTQFLISNDDVDTTSVKVYFKENSDAEETEFLFKEDIYGVSTDDNVFYIQPVLEDQYEVVFGAGTFGKQPEIGNIIRIQYRTTNAENANGITQMSSENLDGYVTTVVVTGRSEGGFDRESIDSIKFFAPKSIQIQNRAITSRDYEILIKNNFPEVKSLAAYGGEKLFPPQYGRVVISVDSLNGDGISSNIKQQMANFLSERSALSIEPIIEDSQFMYLQVNGDIYYDVNKTTTSTAEIRSAILNTISQYSFNNLESYGKNFRYSRLTSDIDDNDYIISNDISVIPFMKIFPRRNSSNYFILEFSNELRANLPYVESSIATYTPSVYSSQFTYSNIIARLQDDGNGNLIIISDDNVILEKDIGSVNYFTGEVILRYVTITDYPDTGINIYGTTVNKKIDAPINRILQIDNSSINIIGTTE